MGRIAVGFHRLGLVLAVPLVLASFIPLVDQVFDPSGPPVADPDARPSQSLLSANNAQMIKNLAAPQENYRITFDTDGRKLFVSTPSDKLLSGALDDFTAEERRRGELIAPSEMPVWIGNVKFEYQPDNRMPPTTSVLTKHLKRSFDWTAFGWSGLLLAGAAGLYAAARMVAWILEGFVYGARRNEPSV